jgi:hypothetical protein
MVRSVESAGHTASIEAAVLMRWLEATAAPTLVPPTPDVFWSRLPKPVAALFTHVSSSVSSEAAPMTNHVIQRYSFDPPVGVTVLGFGASVEAEATALISGAEPLDWPEIS